MSNTDYQNLLVLLGCETNPDKITAVMDCACETTEKKFLVEVPYVGFVLMCQFCSSREEMCRQYRAHSARESAANFLASLDLGNTANIC